MNDTTKNTFNLYDNSLKNKNKDSPKNSINKMVEQNIIKTITPLNQFHEKSNSKNHSLNNNNESKGNSINEKNIMKNNDSIRKSIDEIKTKKSLKEYNNLNNTYKENLINDNLISKKENIKNKEILRKNKIQKINIIK